MEIPLAKNLNDYVALMAANSPHALVMDWWRRVDLALDDYGTARRPVVDHENRDAIEKAVSEDEALGPAVAELIRRLRLMRNQVAHDTTYNLSSEAPAAYAWQAFSLIAALGRRLSRLEGTLPLWIPEGTL